MSQAADREGTFRADIIEYGLFEAESGAVAVNLKAKLLEFWSEGQWHPWEDYGQEAEGSVWVVKKDGSLNSKSVESLMRNAGWDGNIESVVNGTWQPDRCQVVLTQDNYQGNVSYKIAFINQADRTPGATGNVTPEKAKQLAGKHGQALRAIASTVKRNTSVPGDRPPAPPKSGKIEGMDRAQYDKANAAMQEAADGEDIPF